MRRQKTFLNNQSNWSGSERKLNRVSIPYLRQWNPAKQRERFRLNRIFLGNPVIAHYRSLRYGVVWPDTNIYSEEYGSSPYLEPNSALNVRRYQSSNDI